LIDGSITAVAEYLGFVLVNLLDFVVSIGFMHLFNQISKEPAAKAEAPTTPMLLLKKQTDNSKSLKELYKDLQDEGIEFDQESFDT
jgi:hypothetical protein